MSQGTIAVPRPLIAAAPAAVARVRSLPLVVKFFMAFLCMVTVFGKGPTYLGVPPIFWAEMCMGLLILWMLLRGGVTAFFMPSPHALSLAVSAYMALGAVLVAIHAPAGGIEALRDGAIWYYGFFYFIGLYLARDSNMADRLWKMFRIFWVLAMVWGVVDFATGRVLEEAPPILPWRGVSLWSNSNSELIQNMSFGAVIVLGTSLLDGRTWSKIFITPVALAALVFMVQDYGRGAKVGFVVGVLIALTLTWSGARAFRFGRTVAPLLIIGVIGLLFAAAALELDLAKVTNMDRFVKDQGTAGWRTLWWIDLYEGVMEENPLFGLGFGRDWWTYNPEINMDRFDPHPVRSPHNFNVTVFSRMGIVGAALWLAVLGIGIIGLYRRIWQGGFSPERQQEMAIWIAFIVCTWLNSTFGVLMEGPVLGVWFWFALGFAWGRSRELRASPGVAR